MAALVDVRYVKEEPRYLGKGRELHFRLVRSVWSLTAPLQYQLETRLREFPAVSTKKEIRALRKRIPSLPLADEPEIDLYRWLDENVSGVCNVTIREHWIKKFGLRPFAYIHPPDHIRCTVKFTEAKDAVAFKLRFECYDPPPEYLPFP